jgi:hypothetical protein
MDKLEQTLMELGINSKDIPKASNFKIEAGTLKDADTMQLDTGTTLRVPGINARESGKLKEDGFVPPQLGADTQTGLVRDIINQEGFTNPVLGTDKDVYNRNLGELTDANGRRLSNRLLESGYVDPSTSVTSDQLNSMYLGRLDRAKRQAEGTQTIADKLLTDLNVERNQGGVMAKRFTTTAKEFGAAVGEGTSSDYFAGPAIIRPGEDRYGKATSNWDTGLDIGMANTKQGFFGAIDMLGTKTGISYLEELGKRNIKQQESILRDLPYLKSPEAFDDKGNWKLDSFSKVIDYSVGTAAASAPQMVTSIVATMASPMTGGASMSVPVATYTGQVWNAQKEKNATAAIMSGVTQAALDKLGLSGIASGAALKITDKATQAMVVKELMGRGVTAEAAEKMIIRSTQEAIKDVSDAMRSVAMKQNLGPAAIAGAIAKGSASEGITEGLQEIAGYLGETVAIPESKEDWNKLQNRTMNAMAGGAILGGGLSGAGRTVATLANSSSPTREGTDLQFREQYKERFGTTNIPTVSEVIIKAEKNISSTSDTPSLEKLAELETSKRAIEGVVSKTGSFMKDKGLSSLFGKWSTVIMKGKDYSGEALAALSTLLGSTRAINGMSIDETQDILEANIFKNFGNKEEMQSAFGGMTTSKASTILAKPTVVSVIDRLVRQRRLTGSFDRLDIDADLGQDIVHKEGILLYAAKIDNLINDYNRATGSDLSVASFIANRPLDKTLVSKNFNQFTRDIQDAFGISQAEASMMAQSVLNNGDVNSVEDSIDEWLNPDANRIKGKAEVEKAINNPEIKAKFAQYMSQDLLDNAYTLAAKGSAVATNKQFIGKDGSKLATLLQDSLNKGEITEQEASFMAREIKDFLDMRAGKYNPITNEYARGALNLVNFLSTVTSLPLAAVSSTVEFAQVYRNLNSPQSIKATRILLNTFGKEFGSLFKELGESFGMKNSTASKHRRELSEAGFLREGGIGTRNDILSGYFQKWTEGFFKVTGLTSITAITRHAKLSIAADAINHWVDVAQGKGTFTPQQIQDAKEHLIRIGVDLDFMTSIDKDTPQNEQRVLANLQAGAYNFVNEAVVVPSQLNRPKFYSDPYLRLFTQFQGYTSTFTATTLPRLLGDLGKKGSDDQRNAAATIAMMFALSMLALYIKDMIKYNEHPPKWLKEDKEFQRLIGQVGLLGTGQRVWDSVSPMFGGDKKANSVLGQVYNQLSDQSPQLAFINKLNEVLSAPEEKRIEKGARLLPIVGTSPALAKYLQKELGE